MTTLQRYLEPEMLRRLSTLGVSARTVAAGVATGRHRAPVRGSSIEFRQHRFYSAGDEPRRIDWRVVARTDRVYVREYEQETNLRCLLLLDSSGSMSYAGQADGRVARGGAASQTKLLFARRACAALAYLMLSQTESVGLATFGGTSQFVPPHAGKAQLARLLDTLDRTVGGGPGLFGNAAAAAANRLSRRTLVIVLSDLFAEPAEIARGLARLRHDRHEVAMLRVLHADELAFPFKRSSRFAGLEGETVRLIEPAVAKSAYLARFSHHAGQLERACRGLGVSLRQATSESDLADAIARLVSDRA